MKDANIENASNDSVAEGAFETKILDPKVHGEALSALKNLGYSPHESAQVVARILTSDEEVEDLSLAGSTIFFCPRSDESEIDVLRVGDIDLERSLRVARAK